MPYSLILNLTPISPISPNYLCGRHLHALFLTLVSKVDQDLGDRLHSSQSNKPFTLSPLQLNYPKRYSHQLQWEHKTAIKKGTPCWWRISLLDDELFSQLTQLWLNLNTQQSWHLGSADLNINSIQGTSHSQQPWGNSCLYPELYEDASETETTFKFTLATPVSFRQGKQDTALPTAELVFNSLWKRWNKYSGIEFSQLPLDQIFPSYFNIKTVIISDSRSKLIGCVGEISYRVFGDIDPLQIKQLNTLADFALYSGIGRKNTMGFGMIRRI
ncbi:CRISPR-associated protein, Cas6 family [Halothece sp. PCC 7418]|uniref:CRISPR-associated endoribonuclease Cas6 n=1 Tax=Halothece sp. (strain PCC 7418) TaxID=65093 RepID=UPI0002A05AEF|nr:CRISPR-associated endoribonuclease Cas6 [Halothece sp. PCC 7418]AFZ42910.1 CRISPR-associated protein, Cas6 family [Halothece sp. PCC 7418]